MPLLVDGHNLIGQMRDLSLSDPDDEDKLITRLRSVAERAQKRISVVFDPNPSDATPRIGPGKRQHGLVSVIFALHGSKADDVIRQMVGEIRDKQGLTVVTSDAAVADFTRRCGVRVQSSQDFIKWMNASSAKSSSTAIKPVGSAQEVVNWADVFKEPEPPAKPAKAAPRTTKKPKTRSEQLKEQVRKKRPLF